MKAIKLFIQYNRSSAAVIRELGYPSRKLLFRWYKRYQEELQTGVVWDSCKGKERYSKKQKEIAVQHYVEHGRNASQTVKALGYPCREILRKWCEESGVDVRKRHTNGIQYSPEQKQEMVIDLCTRSKKTATQVASDNGVQRNDLYSWKLQLLGKGTPNKMPKKEESTFSTSETIDKSNEKELLLLEIDELKKQIERLKIEKLILEKTEEILKKEKSIDHKTLTNKEKTMVVDALRNKVAFPFLLQTLQLPRSSYFYHHKGLSKPDKYETVSIRIKDLFHENKKCYGYRRIHASLKGEKIIISEKVVRRIMSELTLVVYGKKKRKYSSYKGDHFPSAENIIERDFHADEPNNKWLTDISEFHIPAGKVYLSPIVDCFDGMLPSWSIGTNPDADLVNSMLDHAIHTLKEGEHPLIHSDRGCHYRWPGWIVRMQEADLPRSMSKKGCSPDNAACEGFFGRLKNEMFYNRSWEGVSIDEFIAILDDYLVWYNEKRIKMSLGGMSPLQYRQNLSISC
jgi:putative transposase